MMRDQIRFTCTVSKDQRVFISWRGRRVFIVAGETARKLIAALERSNGREVELLLAKASGNFKRGNER